MERGRLADNFFWGQRDIAIIMGKDQSNISRLLRRMEQDERWKAKLQSFSVSVGQKKGYRDGIFSLILDYCEAEYLERFSQPRRGGPMPESRVEELLEAWQKMRRHVELEVDLSQENGQEKRRNHDVGVVCFLNMSSFLSGDRLLLAE